MRIFAARLGLAPFLDDPVTTVERLASLDRHGHHTLTADSDDADAVLFPQCHMLATDWRLKAIRDHELNRRHPHLAMVYDERDRPWCAFPGVYASMPASAFVQPFQRAWGYFPTERVDGLGEPDLLFSLMASPTHRSRGPLFAVRHPDAIVERVDRFVFFNPGSEGFAVRRIRFRELLGRSRFVLCPRGKGTSSIRLYETLAAGRVPVVISDDWVPPAGPDWGSFVVRWPEGKTDGLVMTLEQRNGEWEQMSSAARAAHETFFAEDVWFHHLATALADIRRQRTLVPMPRAGVRNRAFYVAGADSVWSRAYVRVRKHGRRIARRFSFALRSR